MEQPSLFDQAAVNEPAWAAEWRRRYPGASTPARTPIFEGEFVRFNDFYNVSTGKLDKSYLRVCAVHRLYDRGRISKTQAAAYLKGAVPKGSELAVAEHWTPPRSIPAKQQIAA